MRLYINKILKVYMKHSALGVFPGKALFMALLSVLASLPLAAKGGVDGHALHSRIEAFAEKFPQERVYLHLDNASYMLGDTAYFVAYVIRGDSIVPSRLSKYVYVDVLNAAGIPVAFKKFELRGGRAAGSVELPRTLPPGFYEIRGYTSWMLNFGGGERHSWERFRSKAYRGMLSESFHKFVAGNAGVFSRVFPVYGLCGDGTRDIGVRTGATVEDTCLYVDFYPEGGNIVEGVGARIAYSAHDGRGRELRISGLVMHEGKEVARIESGDDGRGIFDLEGNECLSGSKLYVRVARGGKNSEFPLPEVRKRGYAVRVADAGEHYDVIVSRNGATAGDKLVLAALCRQRVGFVADVDMAGSLEQAIRVDKDGLRTGVNSFVLYDAGGRVLARRLVFAMGGDSARYSSCCSVNVDTLGKAGFTRFRLTAKVGGGHGINVGNAHLSVSVRPASDDKAGASNDGMLTSLLLSSEVRGYIHDADRYFSFGRVADAGALDLLMLVQGWTRYDFEAMSGAEPFVPLYPMERKLTFEGLMCDKHGRAEQTRWKPLEDGYYIYAEMQLGKQRHAVEAKVKGGRFSVPLPDFEGSGDIWLSLNKRSVKEIGKEEAGVAGHLFKTHPLGRYHDKAMVPRNAFPPMGKNLSWYETQVPPGCRYRESSAMEYVTTLSSGELVTYLSDVYGCAGTLAKPFVAARSLLRLLGVDGHGSVRRPGEPVYGDSAWWAASGAEQARKFMRIMRNPLPPDQCIGASIYTLRPDRRQMHLPAKYGETINGEDDISGWYTPHGEGGYEHYQDGPVTSHIEYHYDTKRKVSDAGLYQGYHLMVKGVDKPAEFYVGDYRHAPDSLAHRNRTLYWNPDLVLDGNGEATAEFECSTSKRLAVSVAGITLDGLPIYIQL